MNKKLLFKWSRLLHIYMSTALFSLLIFFSVSGITLNHLDWVSSKNKPQLWQGQLPTDELQNFAPPMSANLLAWLAKHHDLKTPSHFEWDEDANEILIDFEYPAGFAFVVVNTANGQYSIDHQKGSFWQIINDLHKGRHSGTAWRWLIDISAIFMVLFSITGLIILWQNRPKRNTGILLTLLGTATPIVIFLFFVPSITGV